MPRNQAEKIVELIEAFVEAKMGATLTPRAEEDVVRSRKELIESLIKYLP